MGLDHKLYQQLDSIFPLQYKAHIICNTASYKHVLNLKLIDK